MSEERDLRLAVLIDADNAPRSALGDVMAEVAVYGTPTIKRIYGDWTSPNMNSWNPFCWRPPSPPSSSTATPPAKIPPTPHDHRRMDILYSGTCDGFVLVSSDSDFTRLATRLREAGMKVYGMGEKKTPKPFIVACDKFVYIEVIRAAAKQAAEAAKRKEEAQPKRRPRRRTRSARPPAALPRRRSWSSSPSRWRTCARRTGWPIWASWATSC